MSDVMRGAVRNTVAPGPAPVMYVTGASSGIGRAVVELAVTAGYEVGLLDLSVPEFELTPQMEYIKCDITDVESLDAARAQFMRRWSSGPDAVVHCAGTYQHESSELRNVELFDAVTRINTKGSFLVASTFGDDMLRKKRGSLVLLSSIAYLLGDAVEPGAAYASSKGAVVSLGRQLAVEWGSRGVRTNVVVPGVIDTPMTTVVNNKAAHEALLQEIPAQRLGTAREVAEVCVFLSSEKASYVNGVAIPVDGGQTVA